MFTLHAASLVDLALIINASGERLFFYPNGHELERVELKGIIVRNAEAQPVGSGYTHQLSTRVHEITLVRSQLQAEIPDHVIQQGDTVRFDNPMLTLYTVLHVLPNDEERVTIYVR